MNLSKEEQAILLVEYEKYLTDNERHRLYCSKIGWPLSFDKWVRAMADNATDEAKYEG